MEQCSLAANIIHPFWEYHISFDVFSAVNNLDGLGKLLVYESNLYAQRNGREFHTNKQKVKAFLGIDHVMSIGKLPTIKSYWECEQFIGNKGIRTL